MTVKFSFQSMHKNTGLSRESLYPHSVGRRPRPSLRVAGSGSNWLDGWFEALAVRPSDCDGWAEAAESDFVWTRCKI